MPGLETLGKVYIVCGLSWVCRPCWPKIPQTTKIPLNFQSNGYIFLFAKSNGQSGGFVWWFWAFFLYFPWQFKSDNLLWKDDFFSKMTAVVISGCDIGPGIDSDRF